MANRRMFSRKVIDTDYFLDLPATTQVLYFHLALRADDDGFVSAPKRIMRMIGSSDDDYKLLIAKEYIIPFNSGVCVIRHWRVHNYIQKDRYTPTFHKLEMSEVEIDTDNDNTYNLMDTKCIQDGYEPETQVRLGKVRLGKVNKEYKTSLFDFLKTCKTSLTHDEYFEEHGKPHPNYYMIQKFSELPEEEKTGTLVKIYLTLFPEQKKKGVGGSVKANQIFSAILEYPMCPDHETILKLLLYHEGGNLTPWDVERKIKELRPGETTKEQMCYSMDEGMAQQNGQALF